MSFVLLPVFQEITLMHEHQGHQIYFFDGILRPFFQMSLPYIKMQMSLWLLFLLKHQPVEQRSAICAPQQTFFQNHLDRFPLAILIRNQNRLGWINTLYVIWCYSLYCNHAVYLCRCICFSDVSLCIYSGVPMICHPSVLDLLRGDVGCVWPCVRATPGCSLFCDTTAALQGRCVFS